MAQERPDIEYPCNWEFRIIGADQAGLREAIAGIVGNPVSYTHLTLPTNACV